MSQNYGYQRVLPDAYTGAEKREEFAGRYVSIVSGPGAVGDEWV
jgi:hypothetical protein